MLTERGLWISSVIALAIVITITYMALNQEEDWADLEMNEGAIILCAGDQERKYDDDGSIYCVDREPEWLAPMAKHDKALGILDEYIKDSKAWLGKLDKRLVKCEMGVDDAHMRINEILGTK